MATHKITRVFADNPEPISYEVDLKEMDQKVGQFICMYSICNRIEVKGDEAIAYNNAGEFVTLIAWE